MQVQEATDAMVVVMEERATEEQIEKVVARLVEMGMDARPVSRAPSSARSGRDTPMPRSSSCSTASTR
jgi:hypothetical protein